MQGLCLYEDKESGAEVWCLQAAYTITGLKFAYVMCVKIINFL